MALDHLLKLKRIKQQEELSQVQALMSSHYDRILLGLLHMDSVQRTEVKDIQMEHPDQLLIRFPSKSLMFQSI